MRISVNPNQLSKLPLDLADPTVEAYSNRMGKIMSILGKAKVVELGGKKVYVNAKSWSNLQDRVASAKAKTVGKVHGMAVTQAQIDSIKSAMSSSITEGEVGALLNLIKDRFPKVTEGPLYLSKEQTGLARTVAMLPNGSVYIMDKEKGGGVRGGSKSFKPAVKVRFETKTGEVGLECEKVAFIKFRQAAYANKAEALLPQYRETVEEEFAVRAELSEGKDLIGAPDLSSRFEAIKIKGAAEKGFIAWEERLYDGSAADELTAKELVQVMAGALDGLAWLHEEKRMVHCDIKPGNVFVLRTVDGDLVGHLGDLGEAIKAGDRLKGGTFAYSSPEMKGRGQPTDDMWAFGLMLYEKVTGELPSFTENPKGLADSQDKINAALNLPKPTSPNEAHLFNLIRDLLRHNPAERPTAKQAAEMIRECA